MSVCRTSTKVSGPTAATDTSSKGASTEPQPRRAVPGALRAACGAGRPLRVEAYLGHRGSRCCRRDIPHGMATNRGASDRSRPMAVRHGPQRHSKPASCRPTTPNVGRQADRRVHGLGLWRIPGRLVGRRPTATDRHRSVAGSRTRGLHACRVGWARCPTGLSSFGLHPCDATDAPSQSAPETQGADRADTPFRPTN